jgi:hypothetical protein
VRGIVSAYRRVGVRASPRWTNVTGESDRGEIQIQVTARSLTTRHTPIRSLTAASPKTREARPFWELGC